MAENNPPQIGEAAPEQAVVISEELTTAIDPNRSLPIQPTERAKQASQASDSGETVGDDGAAPFPGPPQGERSKPDELATAAPPPVASTEPESTAPIPEEDIWAKLGIPESEANRHIPGSLAPIEPWQSPPPLNMAPEIDTIPLTGTPSGTASPGINLPYNTSGVQTPLGEDHSAIPSPVRVGTASPPAQTFPPPTESPQRTFQTATDFFDTESAQQSEIFSPERPPTHRICAPSDSLPALPDGDEAEAQEAPPEFILDTRSMADIPTPTFAPPTSSTSAKHVIVGESVDFDFESLVNQPSQSPQTNHHIDHDPFPSQPQEPAHSQNQYTPQTATLDDPFQAHPPAAVQPPDSPDPFDIPEFDIDDSVDPPFMNSVPFQRLDPVETDEFGDLDSYDYGPNSASVLSPGSTLNSTDPFIQNTFPPLHSSPPKVSNYTPVAPSSLLPPTDPKYAPGPSNTGPSIPPPQTQKSKTNPGKLQDVPLDMLGPKPRRRHRSSTTSRPSPPIDQQYFQGPPPMGANPPQMPMHMGQPQGQSLSVGQTMHNPMKSTEIFGISEDNMFGMQSNPYQKAAQPFIPAHQQPPPNPYQQFAHQALYHPGQQTVQAQANNYAPPVGKFGVPQNSFIQQPTNNFAPKPPNSYTPQPPNSYTPQPPNSYTPQPPSGYTPQPQGAFAPPPPPPPQNNYMAQPPANYTPQPPHNYTPQPPTDFNSTPPQARSGNVVSVDNYGPPPPAQHTPGMHPASLAGPPPGPPHDNRPSSRTSSVPLQPPTNTYSPVSNYTPSAASKPPSLPPVQEVSPRLGADTRVNASEAGITGQEKSHDKPPLLPTSPSKEPSYGSMLSAAPPPLQRRYSPAPPAAPMIPAASRYSPAPQPAGTRSVSYAPRTSSPLVHCQGVDEKDGLQEAARPMSSHVPNHIKVGPPSSAPTISLPRRSEGTSRPKTSSHLSKLQSPTPANGESKFHLSSRPDYQEGQNYLLPNDESVNDPLQRWKGAPVFCWAGNGNIITSFPTYVPRYDAGQDSPTMKGIPGEIKWQSMKDLIPLESYIAKFPGPLRKGKKKEVVAWLENYIEIYRQRPVEPTAEAETEKAEGILLSQVLLAMVQKDGDLKADPEVISLFDVDSIEQSRPSTAHGPSQTTTLQSAKSPEAFLNSIRSALLRGEVEKAVWQAADERQWAHALLISSALNKEVYANVALEFIRKELQAGFAGNEALAAFYAAISGNAHDSASELVPMSTGPGGPFSINGWKETLVLLLRNKSIDSPGALLSLGNLLASHKRISAAHICYLFSGSLVHIGGIDDPASHFTILGRDPRVHGRSFDIDVEAIILTEILEFARALRSGAPPNLAHLQPYKLFHAAFLDENGKRQEARLYAESLTDAAQSQSKRNSGTVASRAYLSRLEDLSKKVSEGSRDTSSWLSRSGVERTVWNTLATFVAGDDADPSVTKSKVDSKEEGASGPFAGRSTAPPPARSISRNSSIANMNPAQGLGNPYIPSVGQQTPDASPHPAPAQPVPNPMKGLSSPSKATLPNNFSSTSLHADSVPSAIPSEGSVNVAAPSNPTSPAKPSRRGFLDDDDDEADAALASRMAAIKAEEERKEKEAAKKQAGWFSWLRKGEGGPSGPGSGSKDGLGAPMSTGPRKPPSPPPRRPVPQSSSSVGPPPPPPPSNGNAGPPRPASIPPSMMSPPTRAPRSSGGLPSRPPTSGPGGDSASKINPPPRPATAGPTNDIFSLMGGPPPSRRRPRGNRHADAFAQKSMPPTA